jgi:hypothetical protein
MDGLPNSFYVPFQINTYPEMSSYIPMVAGYTRKILQDYSAKNELRTFLYNLCSVNNFNNDTFLTLINTVADRAFYFMTMGANVEKAIVDAAEEACTIESVENLKRYPGLWDYIQHNQAIRQSIPQVEGMLLKAAQEMDHFNRVGYPNLRQQQQQPFPQQPYPQQPYPQQPFPQQPYPQQPYPQQPFPQQPPTQFGRATTHQQLAGQGWQPSPIGWQGNQRNHGALGVTGTNTHHSSPLPGPTTHSAPVRKRGIQTVGKTAKPLEEFGETDEVKYSHTEALPSSHNHEKPKESTMQPTQYNNTPRVTVGQLEGYSLSSDPVNRKYDHIVLDDGSELKPAHTSGWTVTFNPNKPYGTLHNLSKEVKFHLNRHGVVEELIVEITPEMEYINHEIRTSMRRLEQKEGSPRIVPRWDLVEKLEPPKEKVVSVENGEGAEPEEVVEIEVPEAVVLPEVLLAHTLDEANVKFHINMMKYGVDKTGDAPAEFYVKLVQPVYVEESSHVDYLHKLAETTSLLELVSEMKNGFEGDNSSFWYALDKRITDAINFALEKNFQFKDWSIDSFTNDYVELLEALYEAYDSEVPAKLEAVSNKIIKACCNSLTADETSDYFNVITSKDENTGITFDKFQKHVVPFADYCSVTYLPWNLEDLDIGLSKEPVLLTESADPALRKAVVALIRRVKSSYSQFKHHYLVTKDRQIIELTQGFHVKNAILLFTVDA